MEDSMSILPVMLGAALGGLVLLWVHHYGSGWRVASKAGARLPRGSFGWPIIGETLSFTKNPALFASSHIKRYPLLCQHSSLTSKLVGEARPWSPRHFVLRIT
jgi:hypothetical protein